VRVGAKAAGIGRYARAAACALLALAGTTWTRPAQPEARAQEQYTLRTEQSAAKAKELIQKMIQALGGDAYLNVRDQYAFVRLGLFDSNGRLAGYDRVYDYWKFPDKNRTEYSKKRNIIDIYNGDKGWTLDKAGVEELPATRTENFVTGLKEDINHLCRYRLKEEGMIFRYVGSDVLDLRQVDWVELVDRERRTYRIAIPRSDSLPARAQYITRDRERRTRTEVEELFSNYFPVQGVMTPKQVSKSRNGRLIYQAFYEEVKYNTGLGEELFTRESLDQQWAKSGKKKK
jgi:hypothetical protein